MSHLSALAEFADENDTPTEEVIRACLESPLSHTEKDAFLVKYFEGCNERASKEVCRSLKNANMHQALRVVRGILRKVLNLRVLLRKVDRDVNEVRERRLGYTTQGMSADVQEPLRSMPSRLNDRPTMPVLNSNIPRPPPGPIDTRPRERDEERTTVPIYSELPRTELLRSDLPRIFQETVHEMACRIGLLDTGINFSCTSSYGARFRR